MTSAILSTLNVLTKPLEASAVGDAQSSQQEAFVAALQANRALLLEQLQCETGLGDVRELRAEVMAEATWFSSDTEDAIWNFVQECLLLLLALARHLSVQLALFNQNSAVSAARLRTPEMAPPLPPDVLSVTQQKTLGAALQFVVSLGLSPYLAPGVGVPLGHRSAFGAMVGKLVLRGEVVPAVERRLFTTSSVLLQLAELSSLATLVFTRHLGDVMAALCQLGHRPHRADGGSSTKEMVLSIEERKTCREALQSILGKVYQPIVVKELLILQGRPTKQPVPAAAGSSRAGLGSAPPWLRRLCGQLLSERLMQPNGVQAVVRAILEGGPGGDPDWRKCDSVARILAACPQQSVSSDDYYRQVCPQILDLLHLKDRLTALQFQRVATRVLVIIVEDKPQFAQRYLLTPLLGPLRRCATPTGDSQVAVEELEITRCVEDVYKVWVLTGNSPSVPMLKALEEVLPVLFTLLCFTKQNVSHLRAPCQEILLWYLGHAEPFEALSALNQLSGLVVPPQSGLRGQTHGVPPQSGLRGQTHGVPPQSGLREQTHGVPPHFHFTPGSEGGARLTPKETASDEDDVLYERLAEEQWRLDCLMQILAELKDSDLPGDFFLELLQKLTSWTSEEDQEDQEVEVDTSSMTLLEVEQHLSGRAAGRGERLALLQVLAVVCDVLPHTLLLRKTTQVVDFMVSLLQRACAGLERSPAAATESPVESQTLSMGMGLVATMLSAPQVAAEDYACMKRLLPPLEELSQKHPDAVIQELASGLRAVIATHGACKLEDLPRAARSSTDTATMRNNSGVPSETELKINDSRLPSETELKTQPRARDSQLSQSSSRSATAQSRPGPHVTRTHPADNGAPARPTHTSKPVRTQAGSVAGETQARDGGTPPPRTDPPDPGQSRRTDTPRGGLAPERGRTGGGERNPGGVTTGDPAASTGPFWDLLLEACDPEVVTRAVALRTLTRMVQEGDPEAVQAQERVLVLFLENLEHEDSFVYLSAIQGLAVLSDSFPERILQRLLEDFQRGPSLPSSDRERSLETRLKVGEVLMRASRAMGELAPHLGRPLIGVFLQGTRDRDQTVRASCLSNLGELCQRLDYALGPLAQELSCCLTALIKTEKEAEVRRAAVHVITMLLRGLSDKTTQVLGDVLLDLYRALKWVVRSDRDDVTVLHAQLALEELDDVMKKFIFPQQKLEKKIVVLP